MGASSRKFSELRSLKMKINILLLCTFLTLVAGSPVPENIQPGNNTKWSPVLENFQPGYEMHTEIAKRSPVPENIQSGYEMRQGQERGECVCRCDCCDCCPCNEDLDYYY